MSDLDAQLRESQQQVADAQAMIFELNDRIQMARRRMGAGQEVRFDTESAALADLNAHVALMDAQIAELIVAFDHVTMGLSEDVSAMRNKTAWENFVGFFSERKSETLRLERMKTASIDERLAALIVKSDRLAALLQGHLSVLNIQREKVETNLQAVVQDRGAVICALEDSRLGLENLDKAITALEDKISCEQDVAKSDKTSRKMERKLANMKTRRQGLTQQEQDSLSNSQSLGRYITQGEAWMDSLQNQAATQRVLLNKLETDTKQRVVLHDAFNKSLRAAQHYEAAQQQGDEIAVQTAQQGPFAIVGGEAMGQHPRIEDMIEVQEDQVFFARKILVQKAKADEHFARRFHRVVNKRDDNLYGR